MKDEPRPIDCSRAEGLFRGLLEAAPDAIVIVNQEGIIALINSQTEHMFGYGREELLGKNMEILIPENLRDRHIAHRTSFHESPQTRRIGRGQIISARRKDGREFPVEIGISPLETEDGPLGISSIRDITDRIIADEAIHELNRELEARVHQRTAALRMANENLQKEIAERHRLEHEILDISEREQQRIGQDLHDDLGQRIAGISYMSRVLANQLSADSSPECTSAEKIADLLNDALSLTRSLARGLHPVSLKSGGLIAALSDLAERTSDIFSVACTFTGPSENVELNHPVATHLYRIAQEAVTNAVNHGSATGIRITLFSHPDETTLTVADNGKGMPPPDPLHKGLGLRIMQYRSDVIGGSLEFSAPDTGTGTRVTCAVPETICGH